MCHALRVRATPEAEYAIALRGCSRSALVIRSSWPQHAGAYFARQDVASHWSSGPLLMITYDYAYYVHYVAFTRPAGCYVPLRLYATFITVSIGH